MNLYNKLKDIGLEENIDINKGFITRLKNRLYYIVGMLILILFFLNLCVTEAHLEKI